MSKSNLILVRHGQSEWNRLDQFTGWVDVGLSKKGFKEAENGAPEGVHAVRALVDAGMVNDDQFPIMTRVYKILFEGLSAKEAATELMARPLRFEN